MSTHSTLRSVLLTVVPLLAVIGSAAHAQDVQTTTSRMVRTSDLDLRTNPGAAMLRHRIQVAARAVCGEPAFIGAPGAADYSGCVSRAEQDAMAISRTMIAAARTDGRLALANPIR